MVERAKGVAEEGDDEGKVPDWRSERRYVVSAGENPGGSDL